jgi:peptidyl-prolyl cis-trans isomerase C
MACRRDRLPGYLKTDEKDGEFKVALKRAIEGADRGGKNLRRLFFCCSAVLVLLLWGCASVSHKGQTAEVLAWVNGEPVTTGDVLYQLQVSHRREDLAGAGAIDVSDYMQNVINNILLVQEARVMGLDKTPEFKKAIDNYIVRESVVRLHDEEVIGKTKLTEEDIVDYFNKNFNLFTLNYIVTDSEDRAKEALAKLEEGADFEEVASEYSMRGNEEDADIKTKMEEEADTNPHQIVLTLNALGKTPEIEEAVLGMKPGDISGVLQSREQYYIVELVSQKEPDLKNLEEEHVRKKIEKGALKAKQEKREDDYVMELREKAASEGQLHIYEDVLSSLNLKDRSKEEMDKLKKDDRVVAEVYGNKLTVGVIASAVKFDTTKDDILNNWISFKVVDHEALSRHYGETPELKEALESYEKQLLKDAFIKKVILPQIMVSDEILKDYYSEHKDDFASAPRYKLQQITVKSEEEAQAVLKELKGGADFSWVAKNRSTDANREMGGNLGWKTKGKLPVEFWDQLDSLEPGQISPIISMGSSFIIIRMQGKEEGKVPELEKIKGEVFNAYLQGKFGTLMEDYTAKLREGADIRVNEKAVRSLEERLRGGA